LIVDAVIASGVLEHVPMDYESLKELYRVMKPGARLIVTYLPNRASVEEWRLRHRNGRRGHRRLYSRSQIRRLLLHCGFWPLTAGFQIPCRVKARLPGCKDWRAHRNSTG
jgi:hypothetical protein